MISKKHVHFLAASDRLNYGDLLFPIIFNAVVIKYKLQYALHFYGLVKSNFSYFGGIATQSYKQLHANLDSNGGTVVVGGGDVFFANWETLYSYINKNFTLILKYKFFRKINAKFKILDKVLHKKNVLLPFSPANFEFNTQKPIQVVYNAVGGTFGNYEKSDFNLKIIERLKSSTFISVRDNRTIASLQTFKINAKLSPDSAVIMSDFFPLEKLKEKISVKTTLAKNNYFYVQFGYNKSPTNFMETARKLEQMALKHNVIVVLCPIGLALKHNDDVELKKMEQLSPNFKFIMPHNIFDIMWLIANAKAYMGTSLHGALTAQSYNIPYFSLSKKIKKADSYFKTWCPKNSTGTIDFTQIDSIDAKIKNWDYKIAKTYLKEQKQLVYANFETIFKKIELLEN